MLRIGEQAPFFTLPGVLRDVPRAYGLKDLAGRWVVLFFYPRDFSFICPTEVVGFNARYQEIRLGGGEVLGVSVDDPRLHAEWARELGGLQYPLLSDEDRKICRLYEVLDEAEGRAHRATFLIDPQGKLQYINVVARNVGRGVAETVRVLTALQNNRPCPADWEPGQPTLQEI